MDDGIRLLAAIQMAHEQLSLLFGSTEVTRGGRIWGPETEAENLPLLQHRRGIGISTPQSPGWLE